MMIVALPIEPAGTVGHSWGKARQVAVAVVNGRDIESWTVHDVRWDLSHGEGSHGAHHARVVTFLRSHDVEAVGVDHVGESMARMLARMGIRLVTGTAGDARAAAVAVAGQTDASRPADGEARPRP